MNKLYTAVGRIQFTKQAGGIRCPAVKTGGREYGLDIQEMTLWSVLNWHILFLEDVVLLYERRLHQTGFSFSRCFDDCLCRLVQRGLVMEGVGKTGEDALYDLLSGLYPIPISNNFLHRLLSFSHLVFFTCVPYSIAKKAFIIDKRNEEEKKVMRLAKRYILSTAEIVKCMEINKLTFCCEEELLDTLYHDAYTTSDNIADMVRNSPKEEDILTAVAVLYLRKQIIFERI